MGWVSNFVINNWLLLQEYTLCKLYNIYYSNIKNKIIISYKIYSSPLSNSQLFLVSSQNTLHFILCFIFQKKKFSLYITLYTFKNWKIIVIFYKNYHLNFLFLNFGAKNLIFLIFLPNISLHKICDKFKIWGSRFKRQQWNSAGAQSARRHQKQNAARPNECKTDTCVACAAFGSQHGAHPGADCTSRGFSRFPRVKMTARILHEQNPVIASSDCSIFLSDLKPDALEN